jgi:hypothetical protein
VYITVVVLDLCQVSFPDSDEPLVRNKFVKKIQLKKGKAIKFLKKSDKVNN